MTTKETAEALNVSERTVRRHAAEMGLTLNGKTTELDEKAVTIIKAKIEKSGRRDLDNVVQLPNVSTDLEMMVLDARVSEWKTRKIQELQLKLQEKDEKIALDAPKVEFYNTVADAKNAIDMRSAAAVLNIPKLGRNNLFQKLRDLGILDAENCPYREYQDRGYFRVIITSYVDSFGDTHITKKTLVYPRGLEYIRRMVTK